ncbi:MAG: hypothetical protein E3J35_02965 [Methanomassiliicoccales archaeon]|nr:MAG: hypothetical protein E3J35_02965 [Methanomassiliicoccales archaeon]
MRKGILGFGIVLVVLSLILMPYFYPLFGVDSAEDAIEKVRGAPIATGLDIKFKGKIEEIFEWGQHTDRQTIGIEGFEGALGQIVVVTTNESFEVGQEVVVEGKYYGLLTVGFVAGSYDERTQNFAPAEVERVPTFMFWLMFIIFLVGIALIVVGYKKI